MKAGSLPWLCWRALCSSIARKGATPVPGPTMIIGPLSAGSRMTPGSTHAGTCMRWLWSQHRSLARFVWFSAKVTSLYGQDLAALPHDRILKERLKLW